MAARCRQRLPAAADKVTTSSSAHPHPSHSLLRCVEREPQGIALTVAINWRKVVVNVDRVSSRHGDRDWVRSKCTGRAMRQRQALAQASWRQRVAAPRPTIQPGCYQWNLSQRCLVALRSSGHSAATATKWLLQHDGGPKGPAGRRGSRCGSRRI